MSDKDMIDTYIENAMKVENRKKKNRTITERR